ncbi:ARMADILLO REPEAT-CONTAINING PROTEIN-LIKE [Salix viminalis]|uniref:ARMADILLO REPEAT-CONTAINING PROTEIN-LIKE n=1 Tax=Salix viminalis TaxID=40686 RepID=A0A9Q0QB61_SALVM|nr:ARMADILLO REPEAT-CONTAINING PROTEIN-LIKE [Salix viminalis]KAJ6702914.1 ARMADILLO REPEAT-CONTAINING PROTEIN-LIKE [Salix viminalis]
MDNSDSRSISEIESEQQASTEEVVSLAKNPEFDRDILTEFAVILDKFKPVLVAITANEKLMDRLPVKKGVESIEKELTRAQKLIQGAYSRSPIKEIEVVTQELGRSLGLVLFASIDASTEVKQHIAELHRELMNVKFDISFTPSPSPSLSSSPCVIHGPRPSKESGFVSEQGSSINEIEEEKISLGIDDVVFQLRYGNDEEFRLALLVLSDFISDQVIDKEWIHEEDIIPILLNRLGSSKPHNRLTIIQILRVLALDNDENKEKMTDVVCLSGLVKSLARDADEGREAVGLLLELSNISAVRRRIGRIQGCIVMLVTMLNGDDPTSSHDSAKLLIALSSNTQNVLHMAEAGYFKPLVHCLKEGSDMSKILMATAVSRMELTDQCRASLGEDGAVEPLVKMFKSGKLEAKLSALNALQNLSNLTENIKLLITAGIVSPLLQLLFSVTSVLMTLREPASAILARIAQSETILVKQDVAQQMLSLLNLSSPVIQYHLLQALNSIASHSSASKVRRKMKENCAVQLLLPFLTESNIKIRSAALNLLYTLSKDSPEEFMEQLGESYLINIVNIISSSASESEKAAAIGIVSNLPVSNKKSTEVLKRLHFLPILISLVSSGASTSAKTWLEESIAGVLVRFTIPSDKKLQLLSAELGVIPILVKLLASESPLAKCRAAISLAQLSQNSVALRKSRKSRWTCMPPSADTFCQVHDGYCVVKSTFCLVKAGAVPPLIQILEGQEREADEAVLNALATLLQDEIWESGSLYIAKTSAVQAIIRVLESGTVKAQEKALWILERIFGIEEHRSQYGESAQAVLIDLAQNGNPRLKPTVAKVLARLQLLQEQSSYF